MDHENSFSNVFLGSNHDSFVEIIDALSNCNINCYLNKINLKLSYNENLSTNLARLYYSQTKNLKCPLKISYVLLFMFYEKT